MKQTKTLTDARTRTHTRPHVLLACECSQIECTAFRNAGCLAFSCDLQPAEGGHPEWHIKHSVLDILEPPVTFRTQNGTRHHVDHWDLIIAHPPCTYLTYAGSRYLFPGHNLDPDRYEKLKEAARFFRHFLNLSCPHVCIENPAPMKISELPRPNSYAQPFWFGSRWRKRLCFWLKGLPDLLPTIEHPTPRSYVYCTRGGHKRSKSFPEVAEAMVKQWLPVITKQM